MKTTATAVVWRRVLSVCLVCALWGEGKAVMATELSFITSAHGDLLNAAQRLKGAAERTADKQVDVANSAGSLVELLRPTVERAEGELKSEDRTYLNAALAAVKEALRAAEQLHKAAMKTNVAVIRADQKSEDVADDVSQWKGNAISYEEMKQKMGEWKRAADKAAELWKEAAESADSQLSAVDKTLKDAEKAKNALANATTEANKASAAASEDVKDKLKDLTTSLEGMLNEAKTLQTSAETVKGNITGASKEITPTVEKADDFLKALKEDAEKNANDLKTQGLLGGSDNSPNGDGKKTTTGASSSDGSPLTVSCLAATSVLSLYFARVAAMVITA